MKVVRYTDINLQELVLAEPLPMSRGGHTVNILDRDGAQVVFQTPKLRVPFGLSKFGEEDKQSLSLSLGGHPEFEAFLEALDAHMQGAVAAQYESWFGKSASPTALAEFYSSALKKSAAYDSTWRLSIPTYSGKCQAAIFDANREETDLGAVTKGCYAVCLVQLNSLWFVNKRWGTKWKPVQVMVYPPDRVTGFAFLEDI